MLKIIITALMVALVVWSIVRILDQRRASGTSAALRNDRPRGVAAPDDDPEFLWRLERERRRKQQQRPRGEKAEGDGDQADEPPSESTA